MLDASPESSTFSTVQILIDGLDECDKGSLDSFLGLMIRQFSKRSSGQCAVKWILTSRNEVAIREYLGSFADLDLEANSAQVSEAVNAFINVKVDELAARKRYDEALKLFVIESLREKAEGTFLWVSLACAELRKPNVSSINTRLVLGKLLPGLSRLYSRILDQVMDNDMEEMVELALEILRAVTIAIRPLNLGELAVLSGLPFEARESSEVSSQYAEQCGSFLTFRDDLVYLVHQSAKDYLLKHQQAALYPQSLLAEHEKVAHRCIDYVVQDWQQDIQNRRRSSGQSIEQGHGNETTDLQYPLLHWVEHSNAAETKFADYTLDPEFFRRNSELRRQWLKYFLANRKLPHVFQIRIYKFSALHISAVCGTTWVAEKLLEDGLKHIDIRDSWGMTSLHWAVLCGNIRVVELLLKKGADPNMRSTPQSWAGGPRRGTPLGVATSYNSIEIARLLVQHGADVNGKDNASITPLVWSIVKNFPAMTNFLVANGANPNVRNRIGKTTLHIAAACGNVGICTILLKAGAQVNVQDINGLCPVHESAYNSHIEVNKLLYAHGARRYDGEQAERWALDVEGKSSAEKIIRSTWGPSRRSPAGFGRASAPVLRSAGAVEPGTTVPALRSWGYSSSRF